LTELARDLTEAVAEGLLEAKGAVNPLVASTPMFAMQEDEGEDAEMEVAASNGTRDHRIPSLSEPRPSIVESPLVPAIYCFFHDRCQQAAYALIPAASRNSLHYSIGQRLVAASPESTINDRIFDLVTQLNHGIRILTTTEERDRLAQFNLLAGSKAYQSTAFEASRVYLQIAWDLVGGNAWAQQPELMAKITEALVNVEYSLT
jgi:predicted ATPase